MGERRISPRYPRLEESITSQTLHPLRAGLQLWRLLQGMPRLGVDWQVPSGAGNMPEIRIYTKGTGFLGFTFTRHGDA